MVVVIGFWSNLICLRLVIWVVLIVVFDCIWLKVVGIVMMVLVMLILFSLVLICCSSVLMILVFVFLGVMFLLVVVRLRWFEVFIRCLKFWVMLFGVSFVCVWA